MGALNLLITGAAGFLGQATVRAALARGHKVHALTRSAATFPEGVETVEADLAEGMDAALLQGIDAVIHTAGAVSNDAAALQRDTVEATERLIAAAGACDAPPLVVLASSIAVYDAAAAGAIDETSPVESAPETREAYIGAKLAQETALCGAGLRGWCLRIGALYDAERRWNAHIGVSKGSLLVSLGRAGEVPLVHVEDAAEALIRAAETAPNGACEALNIIESALPSRAAFIASEHKGLHMPLHWRMVLPLAWLAERVLGASAPGLLRPKVLRARMQAAQYPNARATARLGWLPQKQFTRRSA